MNKSDLIGKIATGAGLTKAQSEKALNSFIAETTAALKAGDKITLVGFGTFSTVTRAARTGRNPQTGKAIKIAEPPQGFTPQVAIIATGALSVFALQAAKQLESEGIAVSVLHMATVKPLDEEAVLAAAKEAGAIVTVEEHQRIGGLGSAVAEYLARVHPTRQEFVGVADQLGQSGTPAELVEHYGLGVQGIIQAVHRVLDHSTP